MNRANELISVADMAPVACSIMEGEWTGKVPAGWWKEPSRKIR